MLYYLLSSDSQVTGYGLATSIDLGAWGLKRT